RRRRPAPRGARRLHRRRRAARLGGRLGRDRGSHRRRRRHPRRDLRGLPPLRGRRLMPGTLFSTPRPEPSHLLPAAGSALVIALALPVFVLTGFGVTGWGLAAVIWVAVHALDLLLARARAKARSEERRVGKEWGARWAAERQQ